MAERCYFCAGPSCQGYPYPATEKAHPRSCAEPRPRAARVPTYGERFENVGRRLENLRTILDGRGDHGLAAEVHATMRELRDALRSLEAAL